MRTFIATAGLVMVLSPALLAQNAQTMKGDSLQWGPAPAVFPAGAKLAVVRGDPFKAGMFTIELSMPDGYRIPPHSHPTDESIQVKQGTFVFGMGDSFDAAKTRSMMVGDTGTVRAGMHHYASAKGATIVAVTAMGPFALTYVNPSDDPQKQPVRP